MSTFTGFPKDFFAFFRELERNNERAWFEKNKPRYKEIVAGSASAFITAMQPRLARISKQIVADPRPNGGSMFRIYRDVRFSKDKSPYKDHAGIQFRHAQGKNVSAPGFYVHLSPTEVFFGGGVWMPEPPALQKIRDAIADKPKGWKAAIGGKDFKKHFDEVKGESLVRPPKGFDPDHPLIDEIKKKSFVVMRKVDPAAALRTDFIDEAEATFRASVPLMRFLCNALGAKF
jgi:uncharacterized protein (TIGR02453 family)